jgi:hypothetical protein
VVDKIAELVAQAFATKIDEELMGLSLTGDGKDAAMAKKHEAAKPVHVQLEMDELTPEAIAAAKKAMQEAIVGKKKPKYGWSGWHAQKDESSLEKQAKAKIGAAITQPIAVPMEAIDSAINVIGDVSEQDMIAIDSVQAKVVDTLQAKDWAQIAKLKKLDGSHGLIALSMSKTEASPIAASFGSVVPMLPVISFSAYQDQFGEELAVGNFVEVSDKVYNITAILKKEFAKHVLETTVIHYDIAVKEVPQLTGVDMASGVDTGVEIPWEKVEAKPKPFVKDPHMKIGHTFLQPGKGSVPFKASWWGIKEVLPGKLCRVPVGTIRCHACQQITPQGMTVLAPASPPGPIHISCAMHARARTLRAIGKRARATALVNTSVIARAREMKEILWLTKAGKICLDPGDEAPDGNGDPQNLNNHEPGCTCKEARWNRP